MTKKINLKVYEYPIKDKKVGTYIGSYTIREDVPPLNLPGEKLVQTLTYLYTDKIVFKNSSGMIKY